MDDFEKWKKKEKELFYEFVDFFEIDRSFVDRNKKNAKILVKNFKEAVKKSKEEMKKQ